MNRKTGFIPTTLTEQSSCPSACPFKAEKLCYPYFSPLGFQWEALNNDGFYPSQNNSEYHKTHRSIKPISWDQLCKEISILPKHQLWRHNTAGDLPGVGDVIDTKALQQLVDANKKARAQGFTYTHKPVLPSQKPYVPAHLAKVNAQAIYAANKNGFRINLSADSLAEADALADLGIGPVVLVVPSDAPKKMRTPKGRYVIACPAETKGEGGIQCSRCQLCYKDRNAIISFLAHGTKVKKVNLKLKVLNNEKYCG
jgi:hypothetical protein